MGNEHEPIAVFVGERAKEHAIDRTEDSRVRADAERERQDDGGRETRTVRERAPCVARVLGNRVDDLEAAKPPYVFFRLREATEDASRHIARFAGRHTELDIFLRLHLQMEAQLLVELLLEAIAFEESAQSADDSVPHGAKRFARFV